MVLTISPALFVLKTLEAIVILNLSQRHIINASPDYGFIRPSVFSTVPPFLRFPPLNQPQVIPKEIKRYLVWPAAFGMRQKMNAEIARASDLSLLSKRQSTCPSVQKFPLLGWYMKPKSCGWTRFRFNILPFQKIKGLPLIQEISYKDKLWINMKRFQGENNLKLPFLLPSFILPDQIDEFKSAWEKSKSKIWISKPPMGSKAKGIEMITHCSQTASMSHRRLVQKYEENPLLADTLKAEFRVYFLVTSLNPLRIYTLSNEYWVNLSLGNYTAHPDSWNNPYCVHIRQANPDYPQQFCQFDKYFSLEKVLEIQNRFLTDLYVRGQLTRIVKIMEDAIIVALLSANNKMWKMLVKKMDNRYNAYQFSCADFVIDKNYAPKLIEINSFPLMGPIPPLLFEHTQNKMQAEMFNVVGYHFPPTLSVQAKKIIEDGLKSKRKWSVGSKITFDAVFYSFNLSRVEIAKQNKFTGFAFRDRTMYLDAILKELTPDDVRQLMVAEDELSQAKVFKRIFPTHRALSFNINALLHGNYYYKLFDAWENKYGRENKKKGIVLLENLSKMYFSKSD